MSGTRGNSHLDMDDSASGLWEEPERQPQQEQQPFESLNVDSVNDDSQARIFEPFFL